MSNQSNKGKKPNPRFLELKRRFSNVVDLYNPDAVLFTIVAVLLVFGIIMMYTASFSAGEREFGDGGYYLKKQLVFLGIGAVAMFLIAAINYHKIVEIFLPVIVFISYGLNILTLFIGVEVGGARRWIEIGGQQFQPSELLKFSVILLIAWILHVNRDELKNAKSGIIPCLCVIISACGITVLQRHISATLIIFALGFILMFVGGCRITHIIIALASIALIGTIIVSAYLASGSTKYHYIVEDRWLSYTDPEADVQGKTFQTYQSLITIGSGSWFGTGFGNSIQKSSFLPATQNDFIFSIIVEELGFIGGSFVILLFLIFTFRGFYVSSLAKERFGMLLGAGITAQIGAQAILNIAVTTNAVPNTGISLPFFSYGGTALIMQMAQIGVLLSVSKQSKIG